MDVTLAGRMRPGDWSAFDLQPMEAMLAKLDQHQVEADHHDQSR